jgi:ubiquinone/menaquinone biosynthesis C-methylase UbiE
MIEAFDDGTVERAWASGARAWVEFVRNGGDYYRTEVHGPALLDACDPQPGEHALDLGCGEGYFSRALAGRGAEVTGLDLTPELLDFAREEEARASLGIRYVQASASEADRHFPPDSFDLISSCMALQDMSDPFACLRAARALLRPGGRIAMSVPHPCTDPPVREWKRDENGRKVVLQLDRYFDSGPAECRWSMTRLAYSWTTPYWRKTLQEWSEGITAAGLALDRMVEPRPDAAAVAARPELEDCSRMPYFLIFRLIA